MIDGNELLAIFRTQLAGHMAQIESLALALEQDPACRKTAEGLMRTFHTIKGASRAIRLDAIQEMAHAMEDLCHGLLDDATIFRPAFSDLLLASCDLMTAALDAHLAGLAPADGEELLKLVAAFHRGEERLPLVQGKPAPPAPERLITPPMVEDWDELALISGDLASFIRSGSSFRRHLEGNLRLGERCLRDMDQQAQRHTLNRLIQDQRSVLDHFDLLMDQGYRIANAMADRVTEGRLVPLQRVFDNLPRMIRDLAREVGKTCRLETKGGEIRVDQRVARAIHTALTPLLRNAMDHGIELPEERRRMDKASEGTLAVQAEVHEGSVWIEVRDDGRGVQTERLQEKALGLGLVTPEGWHHLQPEQRIGLILHPGMTTNAQVSRLSGRGFGLSIALAEAEKLGGLLQVVSREGQGTTFRLRLPVALALAQVLPVVVGIHPWLGRQVYAIPVRDVVAVHRFSQEQVRHAPGETRIRVGETYLSVHDCSAFLGLGPVRDNPEGKPLLVLTAHGEQMALVVEEILEEQPLVERPIAGWMEAFPIWSGMGQGAGGEPLPVIHASALLHALSQSGERTGIRPEEDILSGEDHGESAPTRTIPTILVVEDSLTVREVERHFLETAGYGVETAVNGEEGWKKALATPFDVIITDLDMPVMDGMTMIRRLVADLADTRPPIVVVSYKDRVEGREAALAAGADHYVVKSEFDSILLLELIRSLLARRRP